jgi:lipopolysaccharide heptosyltransferase II
VLVKRALASFFDGSSWIDEVIPYTLAPGLRGLRDQYRIVTQIRARRFDLAILFPRSFAAAWWPTLAAVPQRAGFVSDARGWLLTRKAYLGKAIKSEHQVHQYLRMLHESLGIAGSAADYLPDVHAPHHAKMQAWLAARRRRPRGRLIALAVAAAYGPAKEWPADDYARLIDVLAQRDGAECVLVGAPGERAKSERIVAASRAGGLIAAGETGIGEAVALLSLCDGFAGNDSGAMHVAGALGIPTVGLFGSTDPGQTGPLGARTRVLYRRIECSPCFRRTCRFGHYNCFAAMTPEDVAAALSALGALSS